MSAKPGLTTSEELLAMRHDGLRYELVDGELKKMALARHVHGKTAIRVTLPLGQYVAAKGLGEVYAAETGFILRCDPDTVCAPDVSFVTNGLEQSETRLGTGPAHPIWPLRWSPQAIDTVILKRKYSNGSEREPSWLWSSILELAQ